MSDPIVFLDGRVSLHLGDVRAVLAAMEPDSVDCVVTSPPYWGLRDYGVDGQIGLERTLGEHLEVMVEVFRLVRRVLKPSGTCWVNYGDCYATAPNGRSAADTKAAGGDDRTFRDKPFSTVGPIYQPDYEKTPRVGASENKGSTAAAHGGRVMSGGLLKPKDLCMVPNRLAIALQEDGWWVRSEIIWAKPNPMPESIRDRPATAHEKIFMLTKSERPTCWRHRDGRWVWTKPEPDYIWIDEDHGEGKRRVNLWVAYDYFYEASAVRQGAASASIERWAQDIDAQEGSHRANGGTKAAMKAVGGPRGRSTHGRHTLGEALPEGERRQKVRAADVAATRHVGHINHTGIEAVERGSRNLRNYEPAPLGVWPIATKPFSEAHFATFPPELAERCILAGCPAGGQVLDPFGGAGTTALVALRHARTAALIELNPEYAAIARRRIETEWKVPVLPPQATDFGPLFQSAEAAE